MEIRDRLFELQDEKYKAFQEKLVPTADPDTVIGVRIPMIRKLAKDITKEKSGEQFMNSLPHKYYDENMLHGLLINEIKDYDKAVAEVERFLPYVDNWAVCDSLNPKVFKKHRDKFIEVVRSWVFSEDLYTSRFGIDMLMGHYLDDDFKPEYLEWVSSIRSDEYYWKMVIAWYFATALAKQWDETISYVEEKRLDRWTHNKTIQKAIESYRITDEQKDYLRTLKVK